MKNRLTTTAFILMMALVFWVSYAQAIVLAQMPFSEDFENGTLYSCWSFSSTGTGNVQVTTTGVPHSGNYHLTMDATTNENDSLNELVLTINLAGQPGIFLSFFHKEFSDESNDMPATFTGSHDSDGVAISADGQTWYKVQGLTANRVYKFILIPHRKRILPYRGSIAHLPDLSIYLLSICKNTTHSHFPLKPGYTLVQGT